jgi:hypothetical protein
LDRQKLKTGNKKMNKNSVGQYEPWPQDKSSGTKMGQCGTMGNNVEQCGSIWNNKEQRWDNVEQWGTQWETQRETQWGTQWGTQCGTQCGTKMEQRWNKDGTMCNNAKHALTTHHV